MVAAAVGNAAAVDALVSAGATVDARDQDGTQVRVTAPVSLSLSLSQRRRW
jgi:hypothetical protein